ncbi:MAG: response regulator transcription factor [Clostridiales bacterium]|nr:response regulator transcription factor [Clostridiales bacterium]
MYNIAICDDNQNSLEQLSKQIHSLLSSQIESLEVYSDAKSFLAALDSRKSQLEILFMDIDLGPDNGIELAKKVLTTHPCTQIIFISGHDKYYTKVYDVEHVYFIKKPVTDNSLIEALEKAIEKFNRTKKDVFFIKTKKGITCLPLDTIYYFEKDRRKIIAISSEGAYSFFGKFEEIMNQLNHRFIRCHNSYIVNLTSVITMEPNHFYMYNKTYVPISKSHKLTAKDSFMEYINELI